MRFFSKLKQKRQPSQTNVNNNSTTTTALPPILVNKSKPALKIDANVNSLPLNEAVAALVPKLDHDSPDSVASLQKLYALLEACTNVDDKVQVILQDNGTLVNKLLDYLESCEKGSSDCSLALLVLFQLSTPEQTKRYIAIDCMAAKVLSLLLCDEPSQHLVVIILVNLITKSDDSIISAANDDDSTDLMSEVVQSDAQIIESLSYCLRASTLTQQSFNHRILESDRQDQKMPSELLKDLLAEDLPLDTTNVLSDPSSHLFPQTVRWCLVAIKHLTRPVESPVVALSLVNAGIIPYILQFIILSDKMKIKEINYEKPQLLDSQQSDSGTTSHSSLDTPVPADPLCKTESEAQQETQKFEKIQTWTVETPQDAAIQIMLHLSSVPVIRDYLVRIGTEQVVTDIVSCKNTNSNDETANFIKLRALFIIAHLNEMEGKFEQKSQKSRDKKDQSTLSSLEEVSTYLIADHEAFLLEGVMAIVLNGRTKTGIVSYSASILSLRSIVTAIRYVLTSRANQQRLNACCGVRMNALLLKVLALFLFANDKNRIDAETAGHACFSLYLLSSHGFNDAFLSEEYATITASILSTYKELDLSAASDHAVSQLLLRLKWLNFDGTIDHVVADQSVVTCTDIWLSDNGVLDKISSIEMEYKSGARPNADIFDRPLLRCRAPKKGQTLASPWDTRSNTIVAFGNALEAAQELSYGSLKVRHVHDVDEIQVANNIAHCAAGEKTVSYSYWWSWKDTAKEIHRNLERQRSSEAFLTFQKPALSGINMIMLGGLCACDTTTDSIIEEVM